MGLLLVGVCTPGPAQASLGYEPDATVPQIPTGAQVQHGLAIDPVNQRIYVAVVARTLSVDLNGEVLQLHLDGTPTSNSPFTAGSSAFFGGVAVNPVTEALYASRGILEPPFGVVGEPRMHLFSATGSPVSSFALSNSTPTAPQIATDSSGRVYYPNPATDVVEVFNSSGVLQSTITCGDCPLGLFSAPASVAVDAANNVYVVDMQKDFAVKLKSASESFAFDRLFQSGQGAGAIAVHPLTGDVFVGALPGYHIVAYDSSGVQYDDFAAGMVSDPPAESGKSLTPQIAVHPTTGKLYVSDTSRLVVFEKTTIDPPTVTTNAASSVGQLKASLNATVNANGHAVLECQFEYTDHEDFSVNAYANAASIPCPSKPKTTAAMPLSVGLTGLSPSTTYHYRVVASSNAGSTSGGSQAFTTLPFVPPAVATQPPIGIGRTSAMLVGKVNPKGGSVSDCHFEYGASTSYGTDVPCTSLPGHVTTDVSQSRSVASLTPDTVYHYRLVVTTNAGTGEGADVAFTTASTPVTPPVTPPSDPPPANPPPPPAAALPPVSTPPAATQKRKRLRCRKGFRKKRVRGKLRCVKKKKMKRRAARKRSRRR